MNGGALLGVLLLLSGCDDCMEQLSARAESVERVAWPRWDDATPAGHLVSSRGGLAWDPATEIFHEAKRTGRCPEPLPAAPRTVGRFEDDTLVRDGLYAHLRGGAGLRIGADVPFAQVQLVFDAYRRAGFHEVELRQLRCVGDSCTPESLRVGLSEQHTIDGAELIELRPDVAARRVPPSPSPPIRFEGMADPMETEALDLTVRETETGWAVSGSGGRLAPGCEQQAFEPVDAVPRAAGIEGLVECLDRVKQEFPEEWVVRFVPSGETRWYDVAVQLDRIRMGDGQELFPIVVFPERQ